MKKTNRRGKAFVKQTLPLLLIFTLLLCFNGLAFALSAKPPNDNELGSNSRLLGGQSDDTDGSTVESVNVDDQEIGATSDSGIEADKTSDSETEDSDENSTLSDLTKNLKLDSSKGLAAMVIAIFALFFAMFSKMFGDFFGNDAEEPEDEELPLADAQEPEDEELPPDDAEEPDDEELPPDDAEEPDDDELPPADAEEPDDEELPPADVKEPDDEELPPDDVEEPDDEELPPADVEEPDDEELPPDDEQGETPPKVVDDGDLKLYKDGDFEYLFPPDMDPEEKHEKTKALKDDTELAKRIIRNRVDKYWPEIQKSLPFKSKEDAYAFFMGVAAMESTFDPSVVTGGGHTDYTDKFMEGHGDSAHAIGLFQTAETGYKFDEDNPLGWKNEDVPGIPHAPLNGKNFYDPVVNTDMGIRKMMHFGEQAAETMGKTPEEAAKSQDFWALVLKGHNTGWATYDDGYKNGGEKFDPDWWEFYAKTAGTSGNFLKSEGHLADDVKTWHKDPKAAKYNNGGDYLEWLT